MCTSCEKQVQVMFRMVQSQRDKYEVFLSTTTLLMDIAPVYVRFAFTLPSPTENPLVMRQFPYSSRMSTVNALHM